MATYKELEAVFFGFTDNSNDYRDKYLEADAEPQMIVDYADACDVFITNEEAVEMHRIAIDWFKKIEDGGSWGQYRGEAEDELEALSKK